MQRSTNSLSTRISTTFTYGQGRSFQLPSRHMSRKDITEVPKLAEELPSREVRNQERQISLAALVLSQWKMLALGLLAALGSVAADILQPLPLKIVIDNVLGAKALPQWLAPLLSFVFGTNKAAILTFAVVSVVLVALSVAPILFIFVYQYTPRIKKATRAVRKKEGEIASKIQEVFSSIRVVKAFAREKYEKKRFKEASMETVELALRARALKAGLSPGVQLITAFGTALVLWYGARLVLAAELTLGGLTTFLAYLGKLYSPIRALSRLPDNFSKPAIAFERIQEVMDVESKSRAGEKPHKAPEFQGRIEFENVSFGYAPGRLILKDINLVIEPGQTAAFVGPTGAGKTTIISLIPRFYELTSGAIRIDGEDVRNLKLKSLRRQLGFVLQETLLFRAPIWQNIAYGKPAATREETIEAAKLANAHDFIAQLANGYDTMVGERGVTISGGQRQRIGIARAVIRNAPILILDEPTSGLDAVSEAIVFDALHRLMKGRTCIVITHRLATIRKADVIFVLKDGAIVERGTHEQLLALDGLYRHLHDTQFKKEESAIAE